jgi:hypothetical protein
MRIVKSFEDHEFLSGMYSWCSEEELANEHFYWGLGDDGELYLQCTRFSDQTYWHRLGAISNLEDNINLRVMKRIVKEFGHLVIFT